MNIPTSRIIAANWVFQFSILTFIIKIFSVPYNTSIVAHEHMKVYAYVSILEVILQLAIVFLLKGSASDKLILYAILMSFVTLLISIMYTLYCKKYFKECKFRNDIDKQLLHKMLSFAGWSFLGNIGYSLKMQGINILINLFFGPAVNAPMYSTTLQYTPCRCQNFQTTFPTIKKSLNHALYRVFVGLKLSGGRC